MKQITVISGKGGAGKTTLTASLLSFSENPVIVDCDVDASNLHLLLDPITLETEDFYGLDIAMIDADTCIGCGKCRDVCRFDAIDQKIQVVGDKCEGCATCTLVCSVGAITMENRISGQAFMSSTRFGPLVHARLDPGEEASGKLVSHIRTKASDLANRVHAGMILVDGPPGSGCEVIASITGVDLVVIVIEPSISSIHDAERVMDLCDHFRIKPVVVINKFDINLENSKKITALCEDRNIPVAGKIPYDERMVKALTERKTVPEYCKDGLYQLMNAIWTDIEELLSQ